MLVLTRRIDESIMIGDDIKITIVEDGRLAGGKVRVGIQAPPNIQVHREEVYLAIQRDGVNKRTK